MLYYWERVTWRAVSQHYISLSLLLHGVCPAGRAMGGARQCITCGGAPINCPRGETLTDAEIRSNTECCPELCVRFHCPVCGSRSCLCDWRVSLLLPEVYPFPPTLFSDPPWATCVTASVSFFFRSIAVGPAVGFLRPMGVGVEIPGWIRVKSVIGGVASRAWRSLATRE